MSNSNTRTRICMDRSVVPMKLVFTGGTDQMDSIVSSNSAGLIQNMRNDGYCSGSTVKAHSHFRQAMVDTLMYYVPIPE